MLLAARDYHCLREMLVLVSALSIQDPRERPPERQQAADQAHDRAREEGITGAVGNGRNSAKNFSPPW